MHCHREGDSAFETKSAKKTPFSVLVLITELKNSMSLPMWATKNQII